MIDRLKPYPEYKDSDQTWLGFVPRHWPLLPNRALFAEVKDRDHINEEMLSVTITKGIVRQETLLSNSSKKDSSRQDKSAYKLVQPHDIAYNKMRAWQGAIGVSDLRGIISPAYIVMRLREEQNARYFHHLYRTPYFAKEAERWSYGITSDMWSLRPEHFKMIYSALPPRDEQDAIGRFLDHANARIERAIRVKKKLILLLNEQKQAIIHHAVTRGLNPNVLLKPSGIPWLGDIPKHWDVQRLGRLLQLLTGYPFSSGGFLQSEDQVRLLRGINVTPSGVRWDIVVRWKRKPGDGLDEFALKVGDIVLGMDRPIIASGIRAAAITEKDTPSLLLQRVARLRPTDKLDAKFLLLLLRGRLFSDYIAPIFTGISVPHLSPEQIRGFKVMLPPLKEQEAIVKLVDAETATLNSAIERAEREIALLREYRTRLVADVVTGKLDVRAAARHLRVEAAEPQAAVAAEDFGDETELESTSKEDE
jgi:type I restriction enzyme S subunit